MQKYIEDPVLFHRPDIDGGVKFDVRYVVLLASVKPLKLFVYKVFWLRFANRKFSLDHYDDYQKHFTVMNYANPEKLLQVGLLLMLFCFRWYTSRCGCCSCRCCSSSSTRCYCSLAFVVVVFVVFVFSSIAFITIAFITNQL